MPTYVGMARKQNGSYNATISVQMPIFHLHGGELQLDLLSGIAPTLQCC